MTDSVKILIIQPDNKIGGAQKVSDQILKMFQISKIIDYVEISQIYNRSLLKKIIFHSTAIFIILKKIRKFLPDIIVINGSYIYFIIPFVCLLNKNIIYRESSHPKPIRQENKIKKTWKKLVLHLSKSIVVQSKVAKELLISDWGLNSKKIQIVPNFEPMHGNRRENNSSELNYLYVGTLDENKRVDKIIKFLENNSHYKSLWIYGDGPSKNAIEELINKCGISHKIKLMGYKSVEEIYSRNYSGIFMASISEGSPNALREAYAHGIPGVLARDMVGGAHEMSAGVSLTIDLDDKNTPIDKFLFDFNPEYSDFQKSAGNIFEFKNAWMDICRQIKN